MIIDTHCHLDFPEFNFDKQDVLERAKKSGVSSIINVGSSLAGSRRSVELAAEHKEIFVSIGIHPHYADSINEKILNEIRALLKKDKVVAVGEVGLDYYRNKSSREGQKKQFRNFLDIAGENDLPVIVHSREAHQDTLDILKGSGVKGVMHCFSADKDYLKKFLDIGLYVSFTCNLTFKNAKALREIAKDVPLERLLLETDAPFLAPQAFRGKRNEPAYLPHLVKEWSRILNVPEEKIEETTTQNAKALFKLPV